MLLCPLKSGIEDYISIHIFAPSLSSDVQLTCSKINLKQVACRVGICLSERHLTLISDTKCLSCILDLVMIRYSLLIDKWYPWCFAFLLFWHFPCNRWLWNLKISKMELSATKRMHWVWQYWSGTEMYLQPFAFCVLFFSFLISCLFHNHFWWLFVFQKLQFVLHSSFHPEEMD